MKYTFGTTEIAANRLEKLAEVFNPHSSEFIKTYSGSPMVSAVDLGCGPGYTTHMLYMSVRAKEIYGMDNSDTFLYRAMDRFGHCIFVRHDLTRTPFPVKPELMYARFILSHLADPVERINTWSGELSPDGMLLVEEVEDIKTDIPAFKEYLSVNRGLVRSQGAKLYVGKDLAGGTYNGEVITNEPFELAVSNSDAAAMFYPNTKTIWEKEEYVLDTTSASQRREISEQLRELMRNKGGNSGVTWKMRRIALRNTEENQYLEWFI